ncbi:hypothetical protein J437_LFUL004659 [Ladona fulva]|uniref:Sushi domain-containing protein n=1 Tax=Ladona fulva TaxID=123851 RepID=A0A8K0NYP1_LADFU|nr:hypothetical protein J437_LFUL004659 [Ladona fulva]
MGQDQDWEGGGFSEAESFVGRLALVTLENKVISSEEAVNRATYCKSGEREAMIWSWADFLYERQGKIEVEESQLCKKCPLATPPKNGLVAYLEKDKDTEIEDAVNGFIIKYSCINGFTLSKGQDIRSCLINATWDGKQPTCKRVTCDSTDTESNMGATNTKCKGKKKFIISQQILNTTDVSEVNTKEDAPPSTHEPPLAVAEENATHIDVQENNATNDLNGQNETEHELTQEKDILHEVEELDLNSIDNDTRCIGPYGIGRINGWISYGEAYGLEGSQSNHRRGLFGIGTQLDIECDVGFQLMGESQIVCSLGGKWRKRFNYSFTDAELNPQILQAIFEKGEEVVLPKCVPVTCGSPPEIGQGAWEIMERKHWNGGDGLRWNKVWHKSMSKESIYSNVEIESRPEYVVFPSKYESREEFKYGDVAEYDCEYGYALIGPQALHCSQNGIWEWSSRHSRWPGLEYAPRHYPPDKWPHNLDSQKMISKAIEARPAVCLPVRCSMPLPPMNGGYVERREVNDPKAKTKHLDHPDAYYVGDEVINSCADKNVSSTTIKRRRQLIGPRLRRCLPSGQWSSYRPRCKDL